MEEASLGVMATMCCFGVLLGGVVTAIIMAMWEDR